MKKMFMLVLILSLLGITGSVFAADPTDLTYGCTPYFTITLPGGWGAEEDECFVYIVRQHDQDNLSQMFIDSFEGIEDQELFLTEEIQGYTDELLKKTGVGRIKYKPVEPQEQNGLSLFVITGKGRVDSESVSIEIRILFNDQEEASCVIASIADWAGPNDKRDAKLLLDSMRPAEDAPTE